MTLARGIIKSIIKIRNRTIRHISRTSRKNFKRTFLITPYNITRSPNRKIEIYLLSPARHLNSNNTRIHHLSNSLTPINSKQRVRTIMINFCFKLSVIARIHSYYNIFINPNIKSPLMRRSQRSMNLRINEISQTTRNIHNVPRTLLRLNLNGNRQLSPLYIISQISNIARSMSTIISLIISLCQQKIAFQNLSESIAALRSPPDTTSLNLVTTVNHIKLITFQLYQMSI